MSGRKTYDIAPEEREVKEWRAARRLELRNEYMRELYDPKRTEPLLDTGILRFVSTRAQLEKLYTPTVRNVIPFFLIIGLMWGTAEVLNRRRAKREHLYQTGQISYADRVYKYK
ncbi:hypothetical protein KPH14_006499 [Odynerus spinipes]|uniref:NADH dehydrogenase [ubiquinone] 1 beta subcomplex subunit 4 n=1 Tax=Odynerus spinipes TaxID=1348599 RepID=A0AAD9RQJ7_9HYME|nr:hypothetical protein KPH14_006499 [Odynerus spinipes]